MSDDARPETGRSGAVVPEESGRPVVGPDSPRAGTASQGRRIGGIDIARAIAIIGMMAAHVGPVDEGGLWGTVYALPSGRASILFVVLAGLGMAVLDRAQGDRRILLAVRWVWLAAILLVLGLALQALPGQIIWIVLHHYAVLFVIGLLALRLPHALILPLAVLAVVAGPLVFLGYHVGHPRSPIPSGADLFDPAGTIARAILLTGPYPIVTWTAPFLFGMWLGRLDLRRPLVRWALVLHGAAAAVLALLASAYLQIRLGPADNPHDWMYITSADPHSQMPLWLVGSAGSATFILGLSLIVADRLGRLAWPLRAFGQLALTIYVAHVLAIHFWPGLRSPDLAGGALSLLLLTGTGMAFAVAWRAVLPRGPLELMLHAPLALLRPRRQPAIAAGAAPTGEIEPAKPAEGTGSGDPRAARLPDGVASRARPAGAAVAGRRGAVPRRAGAETCGMTFTLKDARTLAGTGGVERPSREEAEAAVRTLIAYIGDDPAREGLRETPARVLRTYDEFYGGYGQSPAGILDRTFEEVGGYDDLVLVRDIPFYSHCEHHMVPFIGRAHIGYYPSGDVTGLSKLARVVDLYAHRLQTQERLTAEIAQAIDAMLTPRGLAVMIEAEHQCMTLRGVQKPGSSTVTTEFAGLFRTDRQEQVRFLTLVRTEPK